MQFKENLAEIESVLNGAGDTFRLAVGSTVQQVQKMITDQKNSQTGFVTSNKAELGAFADGRINIEQFVSVLPRHKVIDTEKINIIERALSVLQEVEQTLGRVQHVSVRPGGSLRESVNQVLANVGRAYGAARVVSLLKSDEYEPSIHSTLLQGAPFQMWTKSERQMAPPVIINIEGEDVDAGSLARFLDAGMKFVLACRGTCAPAPLVRLITPRTFVMQTHDPKNIAALMKWQGPGVAMVGDDCAVFVHDPSGGPHLQARLTVELMPENPKKALGGISVRQQLEELSQLAALSSLSTVGQPAAEPSEDKQKAELPPDPADKLAAWLLNQARDISSA